MNTRLYILISFIGYLAAWILIILVMFHLIRAQDPVPAQSIATSTVASAPIKKQSKLTHAQLVWTYVLEWCESRGDVHAINKQDRDGTPSYYSFQFKPDTFDSFSDIYGVSGSIDEYDAQRAIVEAMVLHAGSIDWEQQFPECVRKFGRPPMR